MNGIVENFQELNEEKEDRNLFNEEDLKKFTDFVKDEETIQEMIATIDQEFIKDMDIAGLKDPIDKEIKKTENQKQKEIFEKKYEELIPSQQDLYEICILGAILKNNIDRIDNPDYKQLAKEYYESINPTIVEKTEEENTNIENIDSTIIKTTEEENTNIENIDSTTVETTEEEPNINIKGTYDSAKADIQEETMTRIIETTEIEDGKKITETSITISAGADMRHMNIIKAQEIFNEKINELHVIQELYSEPNKTTIENMTKQLTEENIKNNISEKGNTNNNENQNGNRYLIGARITEGFIQTLKNILLLDPEPTIKLDIDWGNCEISDKNADIKEDRFININLEITKIDSDTSTEEKEITKIDGDTNTEEKEETKKEEISTENEKEEIETEDSIETEIQEENKEKQKETKPDSITSNNQETDIITKIDTNDTTELDSDTKEIKQENIINENKEIVAEKTDSPEIFIAERIRIALSKEFKRNGKTIDKDKDIQKITNTKNTNKVKVNIDNKDIEFSYTKIDKDWNFDKDENGNLKIKETDKKYYETKLETTETTEKFKVYDIKETNKNITTTLNEEKTKEAFKKYYTFKDSGYSLDENNITIVKDAIGDLQSIKTNLTFNLPQSIIDDQKDKNITNDTIENIIFDKNGEIKSGSGNTYQKYTGENKFLLITQEKDENDNYKKEDKNLNYNIKTIGNSIQIINDEIQINSTTKLADRKENKMASEIENANKTQETFKEYTTDLDTNFQKRQINALGGNKYQLLVIPKIKGVDQDKYITIPFSYNYKPNTQTKYFSFENTNINIPEKNKDGNYFVIKNMYYTIDIPTGEQIAINPKIVLDYKKTEEESIKKTNIPNNNQIKEAQTEKVDNSKGGLQDRNIALLNNITYNSANYLDFSLDENNQEIKYSREIFLDELLGYDQENKNKLVLGTIKFDGNGEIKESEDRNLKINKKNQTLEVKDIFGRKKTLTIPFEIRNNEFVIGTNANPEAKYITKEFTNQKEYLKNRIYDEKATITNKLNEKIKEMGTQRANEFPGLALNVPKEGLRQASNTEGINAIQYLKGPTSTGLYYLNINNQYKDEKNERPEEFLYFKITGTEVELTDMNGKKIEETYIQSNKEYKPGKGLIQVKNNLTITTIKDTTEQENGYPDFNNEPEILKTYLTKTIDQAKPTNYDREVSGQYLRIFGNSRIGHITSLPITTKENNPNKYVYNKEGLKPITPDDMAKDLRDYDKFSNLSMLGGLNEAELKDIFVTKYKTNEDIDEAIKGDNIRIKNNNGKYEYRNISSNKEGEEIRFEENKISKKIQEKVVDDMKKDLGIIASIENITFKYRRDDEKRRVLTDWDKAGNRTIKDIEKQTIKDFMDTNKKEDKKIALQLLGPSKETIILDINDNIYQNIESKDLESGYYKNLFESKLDNETEKEIKVQNETYKVHMESDKKSKENWIIFESKVEGAKE